jgi:hypothetical protein
MKDSSTGLPETLATYGVTPDELSKVSITIAGQSGWLFWAETLAPFILPLIFLGVLFWFLTASAWRGDAGIHLWSIESASH